MRDPICIFLPKAGTFDPTSELKKLFAPEIEDSKLVLISISGSCREGKSFLANFFIRYLRSAGAPDWMEHDAQNLLDGFPWKRSEDSVTKGIQIWPEAFKIKDSTGEEIVVLLMDTQGLFDVNTSIHDSTSLFTLSVLLSSVQIFNVKENIKANHLNDLELFTEFSRRISGTSEQYSENQEKPFQELIFLVRDWMNSHEIPYGWEGGELKLRGLFELDAVDEELAAMRRNIKDCFDSMKCFLMPHPGMEVAGSINFRGQLSDIETPFKENVKVLIEGILRPENLKPKRFNGEELKVCGFAEMVKKYVEELRSGNYPTIERICSLTVEAQNTAIVNECYDEYEKRMSKLCDF